MGIFNRNKELGREQEILELLPKRFHVIARGVARQAAELLDPDEPILAVFYGNGKNAPAIITVAKYSWSFVEGGFGNYEKASPSYGSIDDITAVDNHAGGRLSVEVDGEIFTVQDSVANAEEVAAILRDQAADYRRLMGH